MLMLRVLALLVFGPQNMFDLHGTWQNLKHIQAYIHSNQLSF
jgi:hypothetical protein